MLQLYTRAVLDTFISKRKGETKFGEKVKTLDSKVQLVDQLKASKAKYVLLGIPEDIGVLANRGKAGATTAWKAALSSLLNVQDNKHTKAKRVLVLGHLDFSAQLEAAKQLNVNSPTYYDELSKFVDSIDREVTYLLFQITKAGKKPIIIGGGHNNAYGNIKGSALGHHKAINVVNFDAHTDFRALEGRHSGNGFSYAFKKDFLHKYFMFGLHENYTSKKIFESIASYPERIRYNTFEALAIRKTKSFEYEMHTALEFISDTNFGIEIDCDSIAGIPSSAMTLSAFSINEARQFVSFFGKHKRASYLHICEAAPDATNAKEMYLVGKAISYLITDFIKK